jgi:uncharacterized membrane protein
MFFFLISIQQLKLKRFHQTTIKKKKKWEAARDCYRVARTKKTERRMNKFLTTSVNKRLKRQKKKRT